MPSAYAPGRLHVQDRTNVNLFLCSYTHLVGFAVMLAVVAPAAELTSKELQKRAEAAERSGETVRAYLLYAQAAAADRTHPELWVKAESLRPTAEAQRPEPKIETTVSETAIPRPDADAITGSFTREDLDALERMKPAPRLKPSTAPQSFELRLPTRDLYEEVAKRFGYQVIFDKDFNPSSTPIRFAVTDADYRNALHALEAATATFIVPISETAMLVAQDSQQKRAELEHSEAVAVQIPQRTSIQEAQELAMLIGQTLEIKRIMLDPQRRQIMIRDHAWKVEAAQAILNEMRFGKPEVAVDVELLSVANNSSLSFGLSLPTSFNIVNFGDPTKFLRFGTSTTFIGVGIAEATLFATAARSSAKTLLHSTITANDGAVATFHVGDKFPIQMGGYLPTGGGVGTPGSPGGVTSAVVSTMPFADLTTSPVSITGTMRLTINGLYQYPIVLTNATNNVLGLISYISSVQNTVTATTIQRGTTAKPYSIAIIANGLGITSIELIDDPDGQKIAVMKPADVVSAITTQEYQDATTISRNGTLKFVVGGDSYPITLTTETNNLAGLLEAVKAAKANVTASIFKGTTGSFLQLVSTKSGSLTIQIYDDPDGANLALLSATDEVNQSSTQLGNTIPGATTSGGILGQIALPVPAFNFEDLGLVLKVTPTVHNLEEVSLEIESEFKVLGAGSYNNVPVISTRKYTGKVRLRSNEWAVVAGLLSRQDTKSVSGLVGLMNLPGLGPLFRKTVNSLDESEVLVILKPHVTSLPASEFTSRKFWIGSEGRPLTQL